MKKVIPSLIVIAACLGFYACKKDDVKLPDITVNFSATEMGIDTLAGSANISLNLSRVAGSNVEVNLNFTTNGVSYGTDFTTNPEASGNTLSVTIPAGQTTASIKITKTTDLYDDTKNIIFTLASANNAVVVGDKKEMRLSFGAILSEGNQMTLEGKTEQSNYANTVYVDFSQNIQTAVDRKSWTLGFYCGDQFRVFLNPAIQMAAAATTKSDINTVVVSDTAGMPKLVANMMASQMISLQNVDDLAGDITKTAFAEVAGNEADNKVYLVAFEGNNAKPEDYYKVKVVRNGNGYRVQYGKLGGGEIKTVTIAKDAGYNMVCLSFSDGAIRKPEPQKWDIQWAYSTALTPMGGSPVAYFMQDYISLNTLGNTQAVEVIIPGSEDTPDKKTAYFNNFDASGLSTLSLSPTRDLVGSNWRVTANMSGGAPEPLGVRAGRFYVIKDASGNYYKLRFLKMGINDDGGERGRPQLVYKLIKKAE